jgi:signal transduction histidine kinase
MLEYFREKWQSLVFRLLFYFLLSILALAIVLAISFTQRLRPHVQQQILPNVERYLDYLISDIGNPPDFTIAQRLADELPFEIRIEGQGNNWSSSKAIEPILNYRLEAAPAPYADVFYGHKQRQDILLIERDGLRYLFVAEDGFRRGSERRHWLLFAGLGAILLLLYIGIRRLFRPIGIMSEQVRRIGEGDLQQSITVETRGELGLLAAGINRMSRDIKSMLESKSGLLLAISHELRSPLTRMRVNLELLEDDEIRQQLIDDTREMEALISAILESEKLSSGHAPLSLHKAELAGLVDEVLANHPQQDRIQTHLQPVTLAVDGLRFKLLLKNLLDNALQYSSDSNAPIEIALSADAQAVILEVIDQGIGIPAAEISRLKEAFYRPDSARRRNTGGYGLGLYLCQLIVDAHGGTLSIESEPGKGTRVIVSLPIDNS